MYDFLVNLQSFENQYLTLFFKVISEIITPMPLSLIALIIYWCINKKKGIALALSVIASVTVNTVIKLGVKMPRPFIVNDNIRRLDDTEGFSFPSGHTQQASALGIFLSGLAKSKMTKVLFWGSVTLLMAFSRMYLGMHTPLDVSVGAVLGVFVTMAVIWLCDEALKERKSYLLHIITVISLLAMIFTRFDGDILKMAAISFGAVTGYMLDEKYICYRVPEKLIEKIFAGILGLVIVGVIKYLFSQLPWDNLYIEFLDYGVFGFSITAIAPFLINIVLMKIRRR